MEQDIPSEQTPLAPAPAENRELAEEIIRRYLTLVRYQHRFSHQLLKAWGVSGQQLSVLRYLAANAPRAVNEISHYLHIRDGTTSPLLERMEQAGYVRRSRCAADNRKVLVEPTALGLDIASRAPMGTISRMRARLPDLSVEELQAIDHAIRRLYELAEVDESLLE